MKRLEITLNIKSKFKTRNSLKHLKRLPFRKITIRPKFYPNQRHLALLKTHLKRHENHIEQLDFFLASSTTVCSILDHIRPDLITRLKLTQSFREYVADCRKISLPNLTHLEAHQASSFLKMLKVHRLETLKVIHAYDDLEGLDGKLNAFLATCPQLKALLFEKHFPVLTVDKFGFSLTSLSVSNAENEKASLNQRQYESLKQLLTASFETLEVLLIGNYKGIDGILEFVYPRAKKLHNLFLICPTITRIDAAMESNRSIKDLCVVLHADCDPRLVKTRKILEHSKAVENLSLSCVSGDMSSLIVEASKSMKNLRKIRINSMKGNLRDLQVMEKLEEVFIERLFEQSDVNPFMRLVLSAPRLRELSVRYWGCDKTPFLSKERLARLLTTCTNLNKLHFGGFFRLPNSFVDTLIETKSSLRQLEIESVMPETFRESFRRIEDGTRIQCTALRWKSEKKSLSEDEEDEDSDLDDYDFDSQATDSEEDFYVDEAAVVADDDGDDEIDEVEVVDENEVDHDDRYDENGLRRSKRLRRN
jgi:hypothetical protein